MTKKKVEPTFGSIFRAVEEKAKKTSFLQDTATQITLNGNLDNLPLYVRIEDGMPEVAPYEYINAPFYIDADAETYSRRFPPVDTYTGFKWFMSETQQ